MRALRLAPLMLVLLLSSGCFGYRLMRPEEIEIPNYDPRPVVIPERCEPLIARAAETGMTNVSEADARMVLFCQQQALLRAQEEEAAARRLEAHAEAANFALRVALAVLGATFAILAWAF